MSDLDKNIHRKEGPAPFEKIIVNPIEKERREKEKGHTVFQNSSRAQAFAALISYFKKILTAFGPKGKYSGYLSRQKELASDALAFRELLLHLANEDLSHNPDFTQKLGQLWHNLLDDCNSHELRRAPASGTEEKVKFFIDRVKSYPSGADHTLGYYLTEYAGKDWIPFPFMELLQSLYKEHHANPASSTLQNWISLLNTVVSK